MGELGGGRAVPVLQHACTGHLVALTRHTCLALPEILGKQWYNEQANAHACQAGRWSASPDEKTGRCVPLKYLIGQHAQRPHVHREGSQHSGLPLTSRSNSLQPEVIRSATLPLNRRGQRNMQLCATFAGNHHCCIHDRAESFLTQLRGAWHEPASVTPHF